MKLVIAGGGTGGHLFPGIALAEELLARGGHEVLFVGTARGIEARVVPQQGYRLALVDVGGIKGLGVKGLFVNGARVPKALWQSRTILRDFGADVVVGVGGYASGPLVLAAALSGRPTAILEQNSVPGVTNRILGKVVRRVFLSFEESRRFFPAKKCRLAGNPLRARLRDAAMQQDGAATQQEAPRVLVCGGSQGARAINRLVPAAIALLDEKARPSVVHQTGAADAESTAAAYRDAAIPADVRPFIDDMAAAYRDADLVLGRAGATTIAELTAFGRPAVLIPFPAATDDHQTKNARAMVDAGAALCLPEATLTPESLAAALRPLLAGPAAVQQRAAMAKASRTLGRPDAAREIVDELLALA